MPSSPQPKAKQFIFGSLVYEYTLVRQERKTLSLIVTPEQTIELKCPQETTNERIERFLRKKWLWLEQQLRFFRKYKKTRHIRQYVSGEGYLYLGRQYTLMVQKAREDKVLLKKGKIHVYTTKDIKETRHVKKILNAWYDEKTKKIFQERFERVIQEFGYTPIPTLAIRHMKKRWGSFLVRGVVVMHPKLIHASKECIDYVIMHELCHVVHTKHDKKFYTLLKKKMPHWEKVKEQLEIFGTQVE